MKEAAEQTLFRHTVAFEDLFRTFGQMYLLQLYLNMFTSTNSTFLRREFLHIWMKMATLMQAGRPKIRKSFWIKPLWQSV